MIKIKHLFIGCLLLLGLATVVQPVTVSAGEVSPHSTAFAKSWTACDSNFLGFPPWFRYLTMTDDCTATINSLNQVWVIALNVIDMMIRAAGIIAVGFIMWGGFKYMKSQGDSGKIAEAKTVILNSVIGLVVVIAAVAIVQMVAGSLT